MDTKLIGWLAGILEGEGSFSNTRGTPTIQIQMSDADIIERVCLITGMKPRKPWQPSGKSRTGGKYKEIYACVLCGVNAVQWMMTIYSLMGARRKVAIAKTLDIWRASSRMPRASRGGRFMAICHPDRVRCGQGLCRACYMQKWRMDRRGISIDPLRERRTLAKRAPKGQRSMSSCHPDRVRFAWGLCKLCYMRDYNNKRKALKV